MKRLGVFIFVLLGLFCYPSTNPNRTLWKVQASFCEKNADKLITILRLFVVYFHFQSNTHHMNITALTPMYLGATNAAPAVIFGYLGRMIISSKHINNIFYGLLIISRTRTKVIVKDNIAHSLKKYSAKPTATASPRINETAYFVHFLCKTLSLSKQRLRF